MDERQKEKMNSRLKLSASKLELLPKYNTERSKPEAK